MTIQDRDNERIRVTRKNGYVDIDREQRRTGADAWRVNQSAGLTFEDKFLAQFIAELQEVSDSVRTEKTSSRTASVESSEDAMSVMAHERSHVPEREGDDAVADGRPLGSDRDKPGETGNLPRTSEAKAPSRECARCKQRVLSGECPHCGAWNDAVVLLPQAKLNTELIRKTLENRTNEARLEPDGNVPAAHVEACATIKRWADSLACTAPEAYEQKVWYIAKELQAMLAAAKRSDNALHPIDGTPARADCPCFWCRTQTRHSNEPLPSTETIQTMRSELNIARSVIKAFNPVVEAARALIRFGDEHTPGYASMHFGDLRKALDDAQRPKTAKK